MIGGDEAKIGIRKGGDGYVWVFSGPEAVIYRFSKSRDATVLNEVLKGFNGVLVSDFYSVYDSVTCSQQKCLVHLTRGINDDLLKSPFDEELKELASRFTLLMTPIVEAIDRYGLTKLHLGKFKKVSDRFCRWVADQQFTSTIALGYQKRIGKYGDRLFTFLSYDGVPWNNNFAENAVKLIASRRKFLDGLMSEDGIKDYLIFLSIYQTLRRKGGASCDSCYRERRTYSNSWESSGGRRETALLGLTRGHRGRPTVVATWSFSPARSAPPRGC